MKLIRARGGEDLLQYATLDNELFISGNYAASVDQSVLTKLAEVTFKEFLFRRTMDVSGKSMSVYLSLEPAGYLLTKMQSDNIHFSGLEIPSESRKKVLQIVPSKWDKIRLYLSEIITSAEKNEEKTPFGVMYKSKGGTEGLASDSPSAESAPIFHFFIDSDLSLAYFFHISCEEYIPVDTAKKTVFHGHNGIGEPNYGTHKGDIGSGNGAVIGIEPPLEKILETGPNVSETQILKLYKNSVKRNIFRGESPTSIIFWKKRDVPPHHIPLLMAVTDGNPSSYDYKMLRRWGRNLVYRRKEIDRRELNLFGESSLPFSLNEISIGDSQQFLNATMQELRKNKESRLDKIDFDKMKDFVKMSHSSRKKRVFYAYLSVLEEYLNFRENPPGITNRYDIAIPKREITDLLLRPVSDDEMKNLREKIRSLATVSKKYLTEI